MVHTLFAQSYEIEEESDTYGKFIIGLYEKGYGYTIGTALRRMLLSSLEGAAITACRIKGVKTELSTIKGVKEDVIYILQNLKQVRVKLYSDGPETLKLHAEGEKIVMAKDFEKNPNVDILTPDQIIATLSKDGELDMEVEVSKGRGYVPAEKNKRPEHPLYTLTLDAVFSPITKVNCRINNVSVGERMDYEQIILEIWSDGSIRPSDALAYSAKLICDSMAIFIKPSLQKEERKDMLVETVKREKIKEYLNQSIDILQLSTRPLNCLRNSNINTISQLITKTEAELASIRGLGGKSLKEIIEKLAQLGLSLGTTL